MKQTSIRWNEISIFFGAVGIVLGGAVFLITRAAHAPVGILFGGPLFVAGAFLAGIPMLRWRGERRNIFRAIGAALLLVAAVPFVVVVLLILDVTIGI